MLPNYGKLVVSNAAIVANRQFTIRRPVAILVHGRVANCLGIEGCSIEHERLPHASLTTHPRRCAINAVPRDVAPGRAHHLLTIRRQRCAVNAAERWRCPTLCRLAVATSRINPTPEVRRPCCQLLLGSPVGGGALGCAHRRVDVKPLRRPKGGPSDVG